MIACKGTRINLTIPVDKFFLGVVRSIVIELAEQCGFMDMEAGKIEMAVDEACANVIEHSYHITGRPQFPKGKEKNITIHIFYNEKKMAVEIEDKGERFDYTKYEQVSLKKHLKNMNARGLGLCIIHSFMDKVEYITDSEGCNHLTMIKFIEDRKQEAEKQRSRD